MTGPGQGQGAGTTLDVALRAAVARLKAAGVESPARDARALLAHAAGLAPDRLTLHLPDPLAPEAAEAFERAIAAREARQPVSQITGQRLFWGRSFRVTRDTLDPRPETEGLIEAALEDPFTRILDLGTGTGAILLTLLAERPQATGLGTDTSEAALAVAAANATALGLFPRATFRRADWFDGLEGVFDLIVSNPPYIAEAEMAGLAPEVRDWEPRQALTPGGDGLGPYRAIAAAAPAHLASGGRLIVEIGATQGPAVAALFRAAGLEDVAVRPDLEGRDRVVLGRARGARSPE
ncbi:peptide chain release factor N(5)-glutamine methyltransferase [Solirhodobacter olei]|uniref:peptide chain release factor N(5)-glutamine methyltransferase n=1 Tax=Solirhodobacter olei TaxID=2493082 RepID=UPI000FD8563A|nr:peptide chain release factor N(5)-glutamine methyltransferase [Solirhodobacter olei]